MRKQAGQAAIIGITTLAVVGLIIATAVAAMALSEYKMTDEAAKGNEVFAATEAKVSDNLMRIKKDPAWPSGPLPYTETNSDYLNEVEVTTTISETGSGLEIDVVGVKETVTRNIRAVIYTDTGRVDVFEIEPGML